MTANMRFEGLTLTVESGERSTTDDLDALYEKPNAKASSSSSPRTMNPGNAR